MARLGRVRDASPEALARDWLADGENPEWTEAHRLAANFDTAYRDLTGDRTSPHPLDQFARMSRLAADGH
jgi:hypothetical protein